VHLIFSKYLPSPALPNPTKSKDACGVDWGADGTHGLAGGNGRACISGGFTKQLGWEARIFMTIEQTRKYAQM
jgi:hypothetical protein